MSCTDNHRALSAGYKEDDLLGPRPMVGLVGRPDISSAGFTGSTAEPWVSTRFTYVNIVGKGCEGWLNLFFGEYCAALIRDTDVADMLRKELEEKQ